MNKAQFNELINYLKNRPSEAARLNEIINGKESGRNDSTGSGRSHQEDEWITAKEVGNRIAMSSKWVRERLHLLPKEMIQQSTTGRKTWFINYQQAYECLQIMKIT